MFAACLYDLMKNMHHLTGSEFQMLAIGFVTAFIVSYFSVLWFLKFLNKIQTFCLLLGNPAGILSRKFVCAIIIIIMRIHRACRCKYSARNIGRTIATGVRAAGTGRAKPRETGGNNADLGIDPGYAIVGYGVIDYIGNKFKIVEYGAITTESNQNMNERFKSIHDDLNTIIERTKPEFLAIEELFLTATKRQP